MPLKLVSDYLSEARAREERAVGPEVLVAESNHRIANNLALIAGLLHLHAVEVAKAGAPLSAEDACLLLEEVGGRVQTVARLHRLLANAGEDAVDLRQYLHDIAQAAIGSMSLAGDMVLSQSSGEPCELRPHQALPVGLMVGELVTNAVKYAHPAKVKGRVEVGCRSTPEGDLMIEVCDDGVGLPDGFDPQTSGGLGMRMVRTLARQLGATLSFDSSGVGLTVTVRTPRDRPVEVRRDPRTSDPAPH